MTLATLKHSVKKMLTAIGAPACRIIYLSQVNAEATGAPRILLANVAAMRNLGDHAITLGERAFLDYYFPQYPIVELNSVAWNRMNGIPSIFRAVQDVNAVLLHGGGYMGTLWAGGEEQKAMEIISAVGRIPCAYFPQTVFYADDVEGQAKLVQNRNFYRAHDNVFFCLRDRHSFDFALREFSLTKDRAIYTPDIALFIEDPLPAQERHGVTLCMRNDQERVTSIELAQQLETMCEDLGLAHRRTDTVAPNFFPISQREKKVHDKLLEFKRSELVITDRLHAMIFCAITHTPCLAMNNINGKVAGVYEWIKDLNFIHLVTPENIDEILIEQARHMKTDGYPSTRDLLMPQFDAMAERLGAFLGLRS